MFESVMIAGVVMKAIGNWQHLDSAYHKGMTVMKLALSVGKITSGAAKIQSHMPIDAYFDDNLFFEVNEDEDVAQDQTVIIRDDAGKTHQYRRQSVATLSYQSNSTAFSHV